MPYLLSFAFFTSGAASLIYQVIWQRVLTQEIGIDSVSVSLIVGVFMLGLGIGGAIGGVILSKTNKPILWLLSLETCIGLFGWSSVPLLRYFNGNIIGNVPLLTQVFLNGALLLIPIVAMGATAPLMVKTWETLCDSVASIGKAYGANVLGASLGVFAGGYYLIGTAGLINTSKIAAVVDLVIAALLLVLYKTGQTATDIEVQKTVSDSFITPRLLYVASFITGFVALAYEMAYFRLFTTYFGVTPYVFPTLLFAYLVNMAVGTWLYDRLLNIVKLDILLPLTICSVMLFTIPVIVGQALLLNFPTGQLVLIFDTLITGFEPNVIQIGLSLGVAILLMLPIAAISGVFPILVRTISNGKEDTGKSFAIVYGVQTLGNTTGAIITGFYLFGVIGSVGVIALCCGLLLTVSVLFYMTPSMSGFRRSGIALATLLAIAWITCLSGYDYPSSVRYYASSTNPAKPVRVTESLHGMTYFYDKDSTGQHSGESYVAMASGRYHITSFSGKNFMGDVHGSASVESLAFAVRPDAKKILFLGLGTASELVAFKRLFRDATITVVEINPDLISGMRELGNSEIVDAISSADVHIGDARRVVSSVLPPELRFDYVHIGVDRATTTGAGNLFSKELLQKIKGRLSQNGVVTFYGYPPVVKAALTVFDDIALFSASTGITITLASNAAGLISNKLDSGEFAKNFRLAVDTATRIGTSTFYNEGQFSALRKKGWYVKDREVLVKALEQIPVASDDLLATEYYMNQQGEILPQAFSSGGQPIDMREWGIVMGAKPFPFPKVAAEPAIKEVFSARSDAILSLLTHAGGRLERVDRYSQAGTVSILHERAVKINRSNRASWQWDFPIQSKGIQPKAGEAYLIEMDAAKSGRGVWGLKAYCLYANQAPRVVEKLTESLNAQRLRIMLEVGEYQPTSCIVSLTFEDGPGWGLRSDIRLDSLTISQISER